MIKSDLVPLSLQQQQLAFFFGLNDQKNTSFNKSLYNSLKIEGSFNIKLMVKAIEETILNVEAARIRLFRAEDNSLWQFDMKNNSIPIIKFLHPTDVKTEDKFKIFVDRWLASELLKPWNHFQESSVRFAIIRLNLNYHAMIIMYSHLFFDGRGTHLFNTALLSKYKSLVDNVPYKCSSPSFLESVSSKASQTELRAKKNLVYWTNLIKTSELKGTPLPSSENNDSIVIRQKTSLSQFQNINRLSDNHGVTDCQFLIWRISSLLSKFLDLSNSIIYLANDFRDISELNTIGLFSSVVPFVIPKSKFCPMDIRNNLFSSIYYGQLDQLQFEPILNDLDIKTNTSVRYGVSLVFNHFETDPQTNSPEISELSISHDAFQPPDAAYTASTLAIGINTYNDSYETIAIYNKNWRNSNLVGNIVNGLFDV